MNIKQIAALAGLDVDRTVQLIEEKTGILFVNTERILAKEDLEIVCRVLNVRTEKKQTTADPSSPVTPASPAHTKPRFTPLHGHEETIHLVDTCLQNGYAVFIDTCTLLEREASELLDILEQVFLQNNAKLYIAYSVLLELQKKQTQSEKIRAQIEDMIRRGTAAVVGSNRDAVFFDGVLLQNLVMFRCRGQNTLLISQDRRLSQDALKINTFESIKSMAHVMVCKMTPTADLTKF